MLASLLGPDSLLCPCHVSNEQPGSSGYGSGPQQYSPIGSVEDEADGLDDFRKYYLQLDEKVSQ